ncbi:Ig-like domain-containing protein, partial [Paucilactobacillus suebicus]
MVTSPVNRPATSIEVSAGGYLMAGATVTVNGSSTIYNQSEQATATLNHGATAKVTWSSSNPSVATVDPTTGVITAVRASSTPVIITATATNADGSTVSDSVFVTVSTGVNDETVTAGNSATFTLANAVTSSLNGAKVSYQWYKIVNGISIPVGYNSSSYTTPSTRLSDDGTKYYVVVTISSRGYTYTLQTAPAILHVTQKAVGSVSITGGEDTVEAGDYTASTYASSRITNLIGTISVDGNVLSGNISFLSKYLTADLSNVNFNVPGYYNVNVTFTEDNVTVTFRAEIHVVANSSMINSTSRSISGSRSTSLSKITSTSYSKSVSGSRSKSLSKSISGSKSTSYSKSVSGSRSRSLSKSISGSKSTSLSKSISGSKSTSLSKSISASKSTSLSKSVSGSKSTSLSKSISGSKSTSLSKSISGSKSTSL